MSQQAWDTEQDCGMNVLSWYSKIKEGIRRSIFNGHATPTSVDKDKERMHICDGQVIRQVVKDGRIDFQFGTRYPYKARQYSSPILGLE